jgi:type IV secretory pathway TrbL component
MWLLALTLYLLGMILGYESFSFEKTNARIMLTLLWPLLALFAFGLWLTVTISERFKGNE